MRVSFGEFVLDRGTRQNQRGDELRPLGPKAFELLDLLHADSAILEDLGSKNGTFLRGQRLTGPTLLADGDLFRIGRISLQIRALQVDELTQTDGG